MNICLFGSGSKKINNNYIDVGYDLGKEIALNHHTLVFGGGNDGMMGSVARGVNDFHGKVIAIMPEWMGDFEELFENCDETIFTKSMDERKLKFLNCSDLFIISPGGIGTLDEFFEVYTLKKLKKHEKPIIIFNLNHFFDNMLIMLNAMIEDGFIEDEELFIVVESLDELVEHLN